MRRVHFVVTVLLVPAVSWAGVTSPLARTSAPLMDEGGLVMLALALGGTGLALLRGRRR